MGEPRGIPLRTEKRTPEQARRELEQSLLQQGAVQFDMTIGEQPRRVTALPEEMTAVPVVGELETRRNIIGQGHKAQFQLDRAQTGRLFPEQPSVRIAGQVGFDFGDAHYRLDLADAPDELRTAVVALWNKMERNQALYADNPADMPAALQAEYQMLQERYGKIIEAIRKTETTIEEFPAGSAVPYDRPHMNRLPASDQEIFSSYRAKGWNNLGKRQREHYRELRARLEASPQANAAK